VPLVYYAAPDWKRKTIDDSLQGLVHGLTITPDGILTAGFNGIELYKLVNGTWSRTGIAKGDPSPWPRSGSSDLATGLLRRDRKGAPEKYLAAIEPWHGNKVVVYQSASEGVWAREQIDDTLVDGHTIATADLDGDGNDEIIAGFRGEPQRVYIYKLDSKGWKRQTLDDGGISAASCAVADLNGDGRPDIACIGSATHNLKWYENLGPAKSTPR